MSELCQVWHEQEKRIFHAPAWAGIRKTLALFVLGAIKAKSIVIPLVAEELLAESDAKANSIERRLERFLSNERIDTRFDVGCAFVPDYALFSARTDEARD